MRLLSCVPGKQEHKQALIDRNMQTTCRLTILWKEKTISLVTYALRARLSWCVSTAAFHFQTSHSRFQRAERDKLSAGAGLRTNVPTRSCFTEDSVNYADEAQCDGAAKKLTGQSISILRSGVRPEHKRGVRKTRTLATWKATVRLCTQGRIAGTRCKFHISECNYSMRFDWTRGIAWALIRV